MQKLIPALLLTLLALVSCSKSDDDVAAKSNATWIVSLYKVPGTDAQTPEDKTDVFAGYTFEFNDDNKMVIHTPTGATIDAAKWKIDAVASTTLFAIDNPTAPLDEIAGEWKLTEQTDTDFKMDGKFDASTSIDPILKSLYFTKQ